MDSFVVLCLIPQPTPLCFALKKEFIEKLAEKESSSTKHQVMNVEDYEDELVQKSKYPRMDVGTPAYENKGMLSATSGMYLINFKILSSHPLNLAHSLLRDPSAWHLIMDWAEDKIGYPDFDTRVRGLGSLVTTYQHNIHVI